MMEVRVLMNSISDDGRWCLSQALRPARCHKISHVVSAFGLYFCHHRYSSYSRVQCLGQSLNPIVFM